MAGSQESHRRSRRTGSSRRRSRGGRAKASGRPSGGRGGGGRDRGPSPDQSGSPSRGPRSPSRLRRRRRRTTPRRLPPTRRGRLARTGTRALTLSWMRFHATASIVSLPRSGFGQSMTVVDVAEFLQVSRYTVERWILAGDLRAIDVSGRRTGAGRRLSRRISQESLTEFMEWRASAPPRPVRRPKRRRLEGSRRSRPG